MNHMALSPTCLIGTWITDISFALTLSLERSGRGGSFQQCASVGRKWAIVDNCVYRVFPVRADGPVVVVPWSSPLAIASVYCPRSARRLRAPQQEGSGMHGICLFYDLGQSWGVAEHRRRPFPWNVDNDLGTCKGERRSRQADCLAVLGFGRWFETQNVRGRGGSRSMGRAVGRLGLLQRFGLENVIPPRVVVCA